MRKILPFMVLIIVFGQSSCTKEETLEELLGESGYWDLRNHCDEYGFVIFSSNGTGHLSVDDECMVGYPCLNVLPFDWNVDEETGLLTVAYKNQSSAMMVCSDLNGTVSPSVETTIVSSGTTLITLFGNTFKKPVKP